MSRQISMREALDAGIGDSPALGPLTDGLTFHLWRSRPGYRRACRMLRRRAARLQALGRAILGVEMKPKDARKSLGILLNPFYFSDPRPISEVVFPTTPVERKAEHRELALEELEDGLRYGRLAIVDTEVMPVPCPSPEMAAAASANKRLTIGIRVTEWSPLPSEISEFLRGFDLAASPARTVLWTFNADTGRCELRPAPKSALDKLLDGVPEEQPPGDVKPLEPEDYAAMFDEE